MATYIKQLRGINATSGIVEESAGKKLYDALMGLGDGLMNYAIDTENRKMSRYDYMKERMKKATPEDLATLGSIDLLNKYGKAQLADNPYAVAAIEEYRGQYFSDKFNQEYALLKAQEPVKTVEEEVARYNKMKQQYYIDNFHVSFNTDSFSRGFFATNYSDVNNQANAKVAEQSKSLMAVRDGGITAKLDSIIQDNLSAKPEDMATAVQEVFNDAKLTGFQDDKRMALAEGMLESIAKQTGSSEMLDALGNVSIWTDDYGNPVKAKDRIAMSTYYNIADQKLRAAPNQWYNNQIYALEKMKSKSEIDEYVKTLSPTQLRQLQPAIGRAYAGIAGVEEQEKRRKEMEYASSLKKQQGVQGASIQLQRVLRGYADNTTAKPDDAYQASVDYMASSEYQNLSPEERTHVFGQILMWPSNSRMRNEYKSKWENALANVPYTGTLNTNAEDGVSTAMSLYHANPISFRFSFGDSLANSFNTIQNLSDFSGSTEGGIEMYKKGAIALSNPDTKETIDKEVNDSSFDSSTINITDENGNMQEVPIGDPLLYGPTKDSYRYLRATNISSDSAINSISSSMSNIYVSHKDGNGNIHVYPRAVFTAQTYDSDGNYIDGIWGDSPLDTGFGYMDSKVNAAKSAYPDYDFEWVYDPYSNSMIFRSTNGQISENPKPMNEFRQEVNSYGEQRQQELESQNDTPTDTVSPDSTVVETGNRRATLLSPEEMEWLNK